ncbi:MAG TPA: S9 family peptidase [Gammaproteobacteria bacterium]|nr:S9 family peptidase [Gammaproteobacteria bacterium]
MKKTPLIALSCCLAAGMLLPSAHAASSGKGFQLKDVRKISSLSDPQISPDGKNIAVVISTPDWKQDTRPNRLVLVNATTGKQRTLTWNRDDVSSPSWSPSGNRLAFLAKNAKTKKMQVFVMPMDGGDARPVTNAKRGVDEFSWSPDGKQIAYVAQDAPLNEKAIKHHDKAFRVTSGNFQLRKALAPWHLWIVPSDGGTARRLTKGDFSLDTGQGGVSPLAWSEDGKRIYFTKYPSPYWGPSFHSVIAAVDVATGKLRTVVGVQTSSQFTFSTDDKAYAFMRPRGGDQNNGNAVYVHQSGKTFDPTHALDRNFNNYAWLPDGKLLLQGQLGTHSVFWEQPLHGAAKRLSLGTVQASSDLDVGGNGEIAFIGSTASHPPELYIMKSVHAMPRRLTDVNGFVDKIALGRSKTVNWTGPGGFHEDGVLTYPVDYHRGRKYPLVLVIHGGPEGASTLGFDDLRQLFASAGFLVFQPNYRGSINLGDAYQHAIYRDTGKGPGEDVMAGLKTVEKMGIVDKNRIGVSGWSYGGYMTTWLTGHYNVWKAAVSGAALTDWVMDYTIAFYQRGDLYFFGGSPWTKAYWKIWREQSPIQYSRNVKAPTLIMGDVGDPNVPLVNSYEWYHSLRDNGVTVKFYAYPENTHFPEDIVQTTDVFRRWVGWMKKYLH